MKKFIVAAALALTTGASYAGEVQQTVVQDNFNRIFDAIKHEMGSDADDDAIYAGIAMMAGNKESIYKMCELMGVDIDDRFIDYAGAIRDKAVHYTERSDAAKLIWGLIEPTIKAGGASLLEEKGKDAFLAGSCPGKDEDMIRFLPEGWYAS